MIDPKILLIGLVAVCGYYYVLRPATHIAKKVPHAVVHVVTLGKK